MMLINFTLNNNINTQLNALTTKLNTINKSKNTIKIDSNIAKLESDLKSLQNNLNRLKSSKISLDITSFKRDMKALDSATTKTLKNLSDKKHKIEFETSGAKTVSNNILEIDNALNKLNTSMSAVLNFNNGISNITNGFNKLTQGIKQLGMYAGVISTKAVSEAVKDEQYFARFNSLALQSESDLANYVDMFKQYGKEIGMSAGQIADMAAEYLSAGGTTSLESVRGFLGSTLQAVTAGFVQDASTYARTIKVIANNLGLDTAEGYKAINDSIVTVQNRGVITVEEFGQYAVSTYPNANAAGMDFGEFNALITLASTKMGNPANVMTGMRQFISDISDLTTGASGLSEALGVKIDARAFREKGALQYFQDIKQAILDTGDAVDSVSISKLFGNTRSQSFVNAILQDLDLLEVELEEFKNTNTLGNMYEAVMSSPIKQFESATEKIRTGFSTLGSSLMPIFTEIMTSIAGVLDWVNAWIEKNPVLFEWIVKITASLIALATVGLVLKSVFLILSGTWQIVIGVIGLFKSVLDAVRLTGLIPFMKSMLGWITIIGAVVYALWFMHHNFGDVWNGMLNVAKMVGGGILTVIDAILTGIQVLVQGLAYAIQNFNPLTQAVRAIGTVIGNDAMANFVNPLASITQGGANLIGSAVGSIRGLRDSLYSGVEGAIVTESGNLEFNPFSNSNWNFPTTGSESLQDYVDGISGDVDWSSLVPELGDTLPNSLDDIGDLSSDGINSVKDAVDEYAEAMEKLSEETQKWVEDFEDNIKLFDKVSKKVVNGSSLLKNAKDRATQMTELRTVKETLATKGLSDEVMAEISQMGVDKLAELKALNRMSVEDLKQWNNYTTSTVDDSMAMAQQAVTNIYVTAEQNVNDYKKIADNIYKELKRRGVKI